MPERNYFSPAPRRRPLRTLARALGIVVLVVAVVAAGWFVFVRDSGGPPALPSAQLDAYLKAWQNGDANTMAAQLNLPPADLAGQAMSLTRAVPGSRAAYTRTSLVRTKSGAEARYHAHVDVAGYGPIDWDGVLPFVRVKIDKKDEWRIAWQPAVLYPGLTGTQRLSVRRTWPKRADIVTSGGTVVATAPSGVEIGIKTGSMSSNLAQIKQQLQALAGVDPADVDAAIKGVSDPEAFNTVAVVPNDARYTNVLHPQLGNIDGIFFRFTDPPAQTDIGADVLGTTGAITPQLLKELGAPYRAGDRVGTTGLQRAYEKTLAGTPSRDIVVEDKNKVVRTLERFPGRAGSRVVLTIDMHTQQAAAAALAGLGDQKAAIVALDVRTGQIRAAVSNPPNGFDRALEGTYPPGSTFKIVTSAALLAAGKNGATPAPCPAEDSVYGQKFHNFEGEANLSLNLQRAFAISCNNAFIQLEQQLPAGSLDNAAKSFGFNTPAAIPGYPAPSYPAPKDDAERAASSIGQGRVLVTPAEMASVAAAVASGQWHAPVIATEPKPSAPTVAPLDPNIAATLRSFMAGVVASGGTAAGAGLPSGVIGKTGTAEHDDNTKTHAWFVGVRGNVAFAVIVEDGGVGGEVAAPIAARFLNALG